MADYELSTDTDSLLFDDNDAAAYTRNAERLKKAKRQKYYSFVASILGLALIIFLLLHIPSSRHKTPPGKTDHPPFPGNEPSTNTID
jgi:hypothetical protein